MVTVNEAATELGVHYQTAYRWVREGRLPATKIGAAYHVAEDDLDRFAAAREVPVPPSPVLHVRDWAAQAERFHDLIAAGDEPGARKLISRLHDGAVSVLDICRRVMTPALRRIGDDWERGVLTVAEEHRASAICEWILGPLAAPGRGRPRGVCVVATPPRESHSLPGVMATAVLREARWRVHHLGANVPADALRQLVRGVGADIVVFSPALPHAARAAHAIAADLGNEGVRTLVGAPGASLDDLLERARTC